jgi:hypothetical protein
VTLNGLNKLCFDGNITALISFIKKL